MLSGSRFTKWITPALALAFDDEHLWSVNAPDGEIRRDAISLALDHKTRRVLAVGEAAERMSKDSRFASSLHLVRGLMHGTVSDHDVAEARFRHELRSWPVSPLRFAPRVIVASSMGETAKRALSEALIHAGARDVITLPRLMAAALGAGLSVEDTRPVAILAVDADWAGVAVIAQNRILAATEHPDGLAEVAVEHLARERAPGDLEPANLGLALARLRRDGVRPDDPACRAFFQRLRERFWGRLSELEPATRQAAHHAPLWLTGSCASTPGLPELLLQTWGTSVTVPDRPEEAAIRGAQRVLAELDGVMKSFRSNRA